ncbi:SGM_5486 family transporter-associated protein [Streptomyces sp. CBMA152]|nr:SGM_5486 family transporter-associated protein [Streptomyces sp. CBMA152]
MPVLEPHPTDSHKKLLRLLAAIAAILVVIAVVAVIGARMG